jgi:hypothetical protein
MSEIKLGFTIMQEAFDLHVYSFAATFDTSPETGNYPEGGVPEILGRIFDSGNEGSLRNYLAYSLSVGDKIAVDLLSNNEVYPYGVYSCAPIGWDFTPPLVDNS